MTAGRPSLFHVEYGHNTYPITCFQLLPLRVTVTTPKLSMDYALRPAGNYELMPASFLGFKMTTRSRTPVVAAFDGRPPSGSGSETTSQPWLL